VAWREDFFMPANRANRREYSPFALIRVIRGLEIKIGCGYGRAEDMEGE
jgi:hypothetical protein